jgi:hypothetical protein
VFGQIAHVRDSQDPGCGRIPFLAIILNLGPVNRRELEAYRATNLLPGTMIEQKAERTTGFAIIAAAASAI